MSDHDLARELEALLPCTTDCCPCASPCSIHEHHDTGCGYRGVPAIVAWAERKLAEIEANARTLREALGMMSTAAPHTVVDSLNPIAWAIAVTEEVRLELQAARADSELLRRYFGDLRHVAPTACSRHAPFFVYPCDECGEAIVAARDMAVTVARRAAADSDLLAKVEALLVTHSHLALHVWEDGYSVNIGTGISKARLAPTLRETLRKLCEEES